MEKDGIRATYINGKYALHHEYLKSTTEGGKKYIFTLVTQIQLLILFQGQKLI